MSEKWRLKVCLVGDNGVGKTSVVRRYVLDEFDDRYVTTLGAKASKKEIPLRSPKTGKEVTIVLTIFDIMGSPSLRELLRETYFNGVEGILAVCDVTRPQTLLGLRSWVEAVEKVAGEVPMIILGNKADLTGQAKLTQEQLEAAAAEFHAPCFLTSARTGMNVEKAIKALMISIVRRVALGRGTVELELLE